MVAVSLFTAQLRFALRFGFVRLNGHPLHVFNGVRPFAFKGQYVVYLIARAGQARPPSARANLLLYKGMANSVIALNAGFNSRGNYESNQTQRNRIHYRVIRMTISRIPPMKAPAMTKTLVLIFGFVRLAIAPMIAPAITSAMLLTFPAEAPSGSRHELSGFANTAFANNMAASAALCLIGYPQHPFLLSASQQTFPRCRQGQSCKASRLGL